MRIRMFVYCCNLAIPRSGGIYVALYYKDFQGADPVYFLHDIYILLVHNYTNRPGIAAQIPDHQPFTESLQTFVG